MTSLSEVYGDNRDGPDLRRLYLGTGLFLAGAFLAVVGIVVGTTGALRGFGVGLYGEREIAGVLGGVGVPAVLLGVFTVLPTSNRNKAAAVVGATVCLLGVALFSHAYPTYWVGSSASTDYTLPVAGVYFVGLLVAVWALFVAVVNFKTRNDPGGTVSMTVTRQGETKVIEVPKAEAERFQGGGVGLLGGTPDGEVETQTNRGKRGGSGESSGGGSSGGGSSGGLSSSGGSAGGRSSNARSSGGGSPLGRSTPASDGGTAASDVRDPKDDAPGDGHDAVFLDAEPEPRPEDSYCGNCTHFDYVRTEEGMQPYCGEHDETMADMEACESWAPNNDGSGLPN
jgi:hypothetical protein